MSWWFGKHPFAGPISEDLFGKGLDWLGGFLGDPKLGDQVVHWGNKYEVVRYGGQGASGASAARAFRGYVQRKGWF